MEPESPRRRGQGAVTHDERHRPLQGRVPELVCRLVNARSVCRYAFGK